MTSQEVGDPDVMTRVGRFEDRDAWTAAGWCSLERALEVIGKRSSMLLVREAFYGGRRFDQLVSRTGLSEATTASSLKALVDDGIMAQRPYREASSRTRHEYVLTERGRALFPVVVALVRWGDDLDSGPGGIELIHGECGEPVNVEVRCAAGHEVPLDGTWARLRRRRRD